ncbi:MAG: 4-hydroxythreonine-4-phosphate dehydrogenase PdxA [Chitinophagia bacterium]|nr:4-hydroxythreonine-4-phosphate dehydrogenase PdxA [Chitinophagia bacterium]
MSEQKRPVVGISVGDLNGIGIEIIIKTFSDSRILELCTPVVFASNKVINFYKKSIPELTLNYSNIKEISKANPKQLNIFTVWEEEVEIQPGQMTETGGKYGVKSLQAAVKALKEKNIDALVTAPLNKFTMQSSEFNFTGHTPFLKEAFQADDVLMLMISENMKVALLTEHLAIMDVAKNISKEQIIKKIQLLKNSLIKDFGVERPRIAVLGLNPHAGDEGLVGKEEKEIIRPAILESKKNDCIVMGPYSADAFFARGNHEKFDAVLAMYHDQGLIPFKSLALGEGTNFTAGIPTIRTSPDHGTAFDIAGKNIADESSFRAAIFSAIDIFDTRNNYQEMRRNPLKKIASHVVANAVDEKIEE